MAAMASMLLVAAAAPGAVAQPDPQVAVGPDFVWIDSIIESSCRDSGAPTTDGQGDGFTWWRGYSFTCQLEATDPRVSGTLTGVFNDDCYGVPDRTCVWWNAEEIVNEDGSWTGWVWGTHRPQDPLSTTDPSEATLLKVFTGHGAYDGLTLILHGEGELGAALDFHGLLYEGSPPPPLDELTPAMPADEVVEPATD